MTNQKIIEFNLHHWDCFDTRFSQKFPEIFIQNTILGTFINGNKTHEFDTSIVWADNQKQLEEYLSNLKKESMIKDICVLDKGESSAKLVLESSKPIEISLKNLLNICHVVPDGPVIVVDGMEKYRAFCPKNNVKIFIEGLEEKGSVEGLKIINPDKKQKLTHAEEKALRTAIKYGYYSWPREITLKELGEKLGLSRRGFQDNLRKAEAKVMNREFIDIGR